MAQSIPLGIPASLPWSPIFRATKRRVFLSSLYLIYIYIFIYIILHTVVLALFACARVDGSILRGWSKCRPDIQEAQKRTLVLWIVGCWFVVFFFFFGGGAGIIYTVYIYIILWYLRLAPPRSWHAGRKRLGALGVASASERGSGAVPWGGVGWFWNGTHVMKWYSMISDVSKGEFPSVSLGIATVCMCLVDTINNIS